MPTWVDVLNQIQTHAAFHNAQAKGAVDAVRRHYLQELHKHTGRNVIAYYSGFLSKPAIREAEINDEDKNGFLMAVHGIDTTKGLDLILHTPGGNIAATESIVNYLHRKFGHNIRAIVPQIAMSAGTMIACACESILMTKHANLGPIDPHLNGMPAYGVVQEFRRAFREIKKDPAMAYVWQPIISQYHPTFLTQCEHAIKWSGDFVQHQLETVMFKGDPQAAQKAKRIVKKLSDFRSNRTHQRHIHFDECETTGLKVSLVENDQTLQDNVLTVHHCYMHALMNTPSFKIIENQNGSAFVKQQRAVQMPVQA